MQFQGESSSEVLGARPQEGDRLRPSGGRRPPSVSSGSAFTPGGTGTPVRPAPASPAPVKVKRACTREGLRKPPGAARTQTRKQLAHRSPGRELPGCQPHQCRRPGTVLPESSIPGPGDPGKTAADGCARVVVPESHLSIKFIRN